ncbi:hypothetical protein K7459_30030, partial [Pseudomonas fluorescens]|nr:hypothetical protein [Pseudomonas fluorescens]
MHGFKAVHGYYCIYRNDEVSIRQIVLILEKATLARQRRRDAPESSGDVPMTTAAHTYASDVAFTPAVKEIQTRKGSRE